MTPLLTQSELDELAESAVAEAARIDFGRTPTACDIGHTLQRERIEILARRCCRMMAGDLIEIGCYTGATSVILAALARKYGRKLICIDNFIGGDTYRLQEIEVLFMESIKPWRDVVEFWRVDAHTPATIKRIQERRYCFAFSDDGHSTEVHVTELETLLPVTDGLVCVDDVDYPDVPLAINRVLPDFPEWKVLFGSQLSDAWLLKGGVN